MSENNLPRDGQELPSAKPLTMSAPGYEAGAVMGSIGAEALAELHGLDQGGPPEIFLEMIALFTESTPQLLSEACEAIDNPTQLRMIAHTLKGSCSNFGAHRMEALCLQLEQLGHEANTAGAREVIEDIEREYFHVRTALAHHCAGL